MMLDDKRIDFTLPSQFIGISPGCVHAGFGKDRVSYMCVLRGHNQFEDGDMQFDDLPQPPTGDERHFTHDLQGGCLSTPAWPYTVQLKTVEPGVVTMERFTTYIVLPSQALTEIRLAGTRYLVGSGWLIAFKPGSQCHFLSEFQAYSFVLHPDWEERLERLAFVR